MWPLSVQHVTTGWTNTRNILRPVLRYVALTCCESSGQTIATFGHNISQHRWLSVCKPRPNNRNNSTPLIVADCYRRNMSMRQATPLWHVVELVPMPWPNTIMANRIQQHHATEHPLMLHDKFDRFQMWANNTQHVPTLRRQQYHHCWCLRFFLFLLAFVRISLLCFYRYAPL